jgi:hypothetical protein
MPSKNSKKKQLKNKFIFRKIVEGSGRLSTTFRDHLKYFKDYQIF